MLSVGLRDELPLSFLRYLVEAGPKFILQLTETLNKSLRLDVHNGPKRSVSIEEAHVTDNGAYNDI